MADGAVDEKKDVIEKPLVVEPPKAKVDPPAKDKVDGKDAKEKELRELDADNDDVPDADELFKLSKSALAKRLARHTRAELKALFGTDDVEKIKADAEELKEHRANAEKRRLAALSESERLKEETKKEREGREKAERELQQERDARTFAAYDSSVEKIVAKYVDPEASELAIAKLKAHVLSLDDAELKDEEKVFEKFMADWAKKNPKFAKADGADPAKPEVKKILLTNGGGALRPDRSNPNFANKTPKPGQPNSMSKSEFLDYKRQRGLA